jgi:two-component system response regulator YesN
MSQINSKKYFFLLYFSFLALTILPILLITTYSLNRFTLSMEEEIKKSSQSLFNYIQLTINKEFISIEKDVIHLLDNRYFKELQKKEAPFPLIISSARALQGDLAQIVNKTPLINSLPIYFPQIDRVLTHESTSNLQGSSNKDLFLRVINDDFNHGLTYVEVDSITDLKKQQVYSMVREIPINSDFPRVIICLNISIDNLTAALKELQFSHEMNLQIHNREGELICETGIEDRKKDDLTFSYRTNYRDWTYSAVLSGSYVRNKIRPISQIILTVCIVIIMLGALISYFISLKLYDPISRILNEIRKNRPSLEKETHELKEIETAVTRFMESNSYLQSYIEEQRDPLISSLFRRLFEGSYLSKDQLQESFRILNINSDYTSLIVIAIEIKTKKRDSINLERFTLSSRIKSLSPYDGMILYPVLIRKDQVHILAMGRMTPQKQDELVTRFCREMLAGAETSLDLSLTFGVGSIENNLSLVSHSYELANQALKEKFLMGNRRIIHYREQLKREEKSYPYPHQKIQRLVNLSFMGQEKELVQNLEQMFDSFRSNNYSEMIIRAVLIQITMALTVRLGEKKSSLEFLQNRHLLREMEGMDTMEEMETWLTRVLLELSEIIQKNQRGLSITVEAALTYLEEHYKEDISLTQVAEKLGISSQYLSKKVKEETGKNYVELLNNHRLEESKELINNTNMAVKEVAYITGYASTQYYIKRFREKYGMTPSEMRKNEHIY